MEKYLKQRSYFFTVVYRFLFKGTGTNNAKSFPKVLEANEPLSSETTGVEAPHFASTPVATPIYSLDGKYLGISLSALPHGIYVVKGQKICK